MFIHYLWNNISETLNLNLLNLFNRVFYVLNTFKIDDYALQNTLLVK